MFYAHDGDDARRRSSIALAPSIDCASSSSSTPTMEETLDAGRKMPIEALRRRGNADERCSGYRSAVLAGEASLFAQTSRCTRMSNGARVTRATRRHTRCNCYQIALWVPLTRIHSSQRSSPQSGSQLTKLTPDTYVFNNLISSFPRLISRCVRGWRAAHWLRYAYDGLDSLRVSACLASLLRFSTATLRWLRGAVADVYLAGERDQHASV